MLDEMEPAVSPDPAGEESGRSDVSQVEDEVIPERMLHHFCFTTLGAGQRGRGRR